MTEHKHAWVLRELADGASIDDYEIRCDGMVWDDLCHYETPLVTGKGEIRRKPKPIRIGGVEFPEPIRETPAHGEKCWVIYLTGLAHIDSFHWDNSPYELVWLQRGLLHTSKEAAQQHAEALILLGGGGT